MDTPPAPWQIEQFEGSPKFAEKHPHVCISPPAQTEWSKTADLSIQLANLTLKNANSPAGKLISSKSPIPYSSLMAVVKTYGESLDLNDFVRVVGILEHNATTGSNESISPFNGPVYDVLPTIHVIYATKLSHLDLLVRREQELIENVGI